MSTLRIQSILYRNEPQSIQRAVRSVNAAMDAAVAAGVFESCELAYGDCSPEPLFDNMALEALERESGPRVRLHYRHFGANLGSARGHNTLFEGCVATYVLIMNPDVVLAANALVELSIPFNDDKVGLVEARQLPIEHPKAYDPVTGETGWATTACALIPVDDFVSIGGFDSQTFFLYCDDVDFSWRLRLAGKKVIYRPTAAVFHDKRLAQSGAWQPSAAEQYYSAEAALMLAYKWSREDLARQLVRAFNASALPYLQKAAQEFLRREAAQVLPQPLDGDHRIGEFVGDGYAQHRFGL
ncbi:glycosyltransferase family 2 protein [Pseudorhodoferax sp. Leaf267]|uniref:glycosyltransferase family 2 protein n=1 Tax=Pseudorhodoferax sp. Leaf267 TaxID=1736316 RepID=UPI001F3B3067|nr:glycosyltransferase family 2 protein [Pseudorhodoferax sp. Leaf267]